MRFTDRTVIVTGGASGMGESHVTRFYQEGAEVVIADLLEERGQDLARRLGSRAHFRQLDVASPDSWQRLIAQLVRPADILVNNAAVLREGTIESQTLADVQGTLNVNVVGAFLGMQAVIPGMREKKHGSIINIASTSGIRGSANQLAYSASKFALRGLTKSAAIDLAGSGIRVNAILPAGTRTAMAAGFPESVAHGQPIPRFAEPNEVTSMVLFLASDEASYCTGGDYPVDGGATAGGVG